MYRGLRQRPKFQDVQKELSDKTNLIKAPKRDAMETLQKRLDKRTPRLEMRKQFKLAEHRANLRHEYDRLEGESHEINRLRHTLGEEVAKRTLAAIRERKQELKELYKNAVTPIRHPIQDK